MSKNCYNHCSNNNAKFSYFNDEMNRDVGHEDGDWINRTVITNLWNVVCSGYSKKRMFWKRSKGKLLQSSFLIHMADSITWMIARIYWLSVKADLKVAYTLKAKGGSEYLNFDDPSIQQLNTTSGNNKMSYAETSKQSSSYISASLGSNVLHFNSGNVMEDIGKLDLEELDIKWQMAMLSVRVNRFEKKARRKMNFNNRDATSGRIPMQDHEESIDENASHVYGMIAGRDDENEVAGEFALIGVTSQSDLVRKRIEGSGINSLLLVKVNAARHKLTTVGES
ncbi:hypothetical protein Tco_1217086 [Tanacetum coccineum]